MNTSVIRELIKRGFIFDTDTDTLILHNGSVSHGANITLSWCDRMSHNIIITVFHLQGKTYNYDGDNIYLENKIDIETSDTNKVLQFLDCLGI